MSDVLEELMRWYRSQCDGLWEESSGVQIDTLDNPGWTISIDLKSPIPDVPQTRLERSEDDWIFYWVENSKWKAACGPLNLREALELFLRFVTDGPAPTPRSPP